MENRITIKLDSRNVYSLSGKAYPRRAPLGRDQVAMRRLPFVRRHKAKGKTYLYFVRPDTGERHRLPDEKDVSFDHEYLSQLELMEGREAKPFRPRMVSWVYFISSDDGPVKIGYARNIAMRLEALQTSNPHRLKVIAKVRGSLKEERAYHAKFSDARLHGEWFSRTPAILAEIARLQPRSEGGV